MSDQADISVVRLSRSAWKDHLGGMHVETKLTPLKKKSSGYQILEEDIDMIGAEEALARVVNLYKCQPGVYRVTTCNESKDWETGCIDSYDYKLIPYAEQA